MRYWWVNQNQTYRHEITGGYLWSPKRNANGARNPFYESMREVAPGDLIFSFMDTRILAVGIGSIVLLGKSQALGVRKIWSELGGYWLESESSLYGACQQGASLGGALRRAITNSKHEHLSRITDSSQTSRHVRNVPDSDPCTAANN